MKRITLTVPAEVLTTAKLASQAMDPDVGGYAAFEAPDESGLYRYTVNVSDEYLAAFEAFRAYPDMLQQTIALDFEHRFPDATLPTIEDVTAFCDAVEIINHSAPQTTQGEPQ